MDVTRHVIEDLLPLYFAGEVSPDTRALVEEYLRQHPDLAGTARTEDPLRPSTPSHEETMSLSVDHESRTLERTKGLLQRRSWLFALALTFTVVPLTLSFQNGRVLRVAGRMLFDMPWLGLVYWLVAAGLWITILLFKKHRPWRVALAIAFTVIPPSLVFERGHLVAVMLAAMWPMGIVYWFVAIAFWVAWVLTNRRLGGSGL